MIFVYKTTNLINNKIYIGVHKTDNVNDGYIGSGKLLQNSINFHGKQNFKREILKEFTTLDDAFKYEALLVNQQFINRNDTYNIRLGGFGGWDHINNKENYVSPVKGLIPVKDKDGNTMSVSKDDPRYLSGELVHVTKGKITVIDNNGISKSIEYSNPKFLSGELISIHKNMVTTTDKYGNIHYVKTSDIRLKTNELVGICKGKVSVKDNDGNTMQVSVDDPRYLAGELVHTSKGIKHKIRTCPHCGKVGGGPNMTRYHFDNCKRIIL